MQTNIKEMIGYLTGGKKAQMDTLWALLTFEKAAIRHAIVDITKGQAMRVLMMNTSTTMYMVIKIYCDDGREEVSDNDIAVFFSWDDASNYRQKLYRQMVNEGIGWIIDDGHELCPDWNTDEVEYYYVIKQGKILGDQNVEETH